MTSALRKKMGEAAVKAAQNISNMKVLELLSF